MLTRVVITTAFVLGAGLGAGSGSVAAATMPTCFGKPATAVMQPGVPFHGTADDDVVIGTSGPDEINTGAFESVPGGVDLVCGLGGGDTIRIEGAGSKADAGSGADRLNVSNGAWGLAGAGNDTVDATGAGTYVDGGSGNDTVYGYDGATAHGGSGNDYVGSDGDDAWLYGDSGRDVLDDLGFANNHLDCGSGNDTYLKGNADTQVAANCEHLGER